MVATDLGNDLGMNNLEGDTINQRDEQQTWGTIYDRQMIRDNSDGSFHTMGPWASARTNSFDRLMGLIFTDFPWGVDEGGSSGTAITSRCWFPTFEFF